MNTNSEDYLPKISLNLSIDETQQIVSALEKAIPLLMETRQGLELNYAVRWKSLLVHKINKAREAQ
jgi:hypothetical protein